MKKNRYIIQMIAISALFSFMLSSCMDKNEWEVDSSYDRLFSIKEIKGTVSFDRIGLEWQKPAGTDYFIIEISTDSLENNIELGGTAGSKVYGSDKTIKSSPIVLTGLSSSTKYFLRIKGCSETKAESKWFYPSTPYTTKAEVEEQLFNTVESEDKTGTSVALRWTTGSAVTHIILTDDAGQENRIELDAADIAAAEKLIAELLPSTTYTAYLYNDESKRGTITFTTLIDTGSGTTIMVSPADDLKAILEAANNGDTFVLEAGEYDSETVNISKTISIIGLDIDNKPLLKNFVIKPEGDASITLRSLALDGTGATDGSQAIVYPAGDNFGDLTIEDCVIKNYVKGLLYVNHKTLINSVTITKCMLVDIECAGGDFVDFRSGLTKKLSFTENTVVNCAVARDMFRMDNAVPNYPDATGTITITNNTFDNVTKGVSRRILYIRLGDAFPITFNKNIISNSEGIFSNQSATTIGETLNNNYFNAPNFTNVDIRHHDATGTHTSHNPEYEDAENGDFTVTNSILKGLGIGDPRWLK